MAKRSATLKQMILLTIGLLFFTLVFLHLYHVLHRGWMQSVYITLLTVSYHFAMRLIVGETITRMYRQREFRMDSLGFRIRSFEPKLYEILHVKAWKKKVITARPEQFDIRKASPTELLHNMLQAELVHRVIMVLSFLPLLLIIPYGTAPVFILTSIAACLVDCVFVIIQRYNRPRVIRLMKRYQK